MKENMFPSRRAKIRGISFVTALVSVLGIGTATGYYQAQQYKTQLEDTYKKAMQETAVYVNNISTDLRKGYYAGTPQQMSYISAKLWRESAAAKAALSSLPITELELGSTYRFLSQVGDYAMAISKKAMNDEEVTKEERENLRSLLNHADSMSSHIASLEKGLSSGEITLDKVQTTAAAVRNGEMPEDTPMGGFEELEQSFEGYPTLIYDGPFSDHILDKKAELLKGKQEIDREEARTIAAKALQVDKASLSDLGDEDSKTPSYCFFTGEQTIAVTKNGGYVSYIMGSGTPKGASLSQEQAVTAAEDFLKRIGYGSMTDTYYEMTDGLITINFAYMQEEVICYTDLIKVNVAMDTGEIISMDARGYIVNHQERSLPKPAMTREKAQAQLSSSLQVENARLALIPTGGMNEVLTYEFTCRGENNQGVLVYINALNGREEQLFLLLETEGGVLTQ